MVLRKVFAEFRDVRAPRLCDRDGRRRGEPLR
jgi:hypothetical protein